MSMVECLPDSTKAISFFLCFGSVVERTSVCRPDAASESPSGVKTSKKKRSTAAKKAAETKSSRRHWRAGRFEDGRFRCPIQLFRSDQFRIFRVSAWSVEQAASTNVCLCELCVE